MSHPAYEQLQQSARRVAKTLPVPAFYEHHAKTVRFAGELLSASELLSECRAYLDESKLECAHGLCHCEAVARDAGALVLIEAPSRGIGGDDAAGLFLAAELAGLLHDIKRKETWRPASASRKASACPARPLPSTSTSNVCTAISTSMGGLHYIAAQREDTGRGRADCNELCRQPPVCAGMDATLHPLQVVPRPARSDILRASSKPAPVKDPGGTTSAQMSEREVDQLLVERAQRGDKQAFGLLVSKYQRKLGRLLSRLIRDPAEVEDVAQEAFIKAYRAD